jgi:surface carbohydrate biosynthesis protein (TIGR04326 family)
MKILLIFDHCFDTDLIVDFFKKHKYCEVVIFSLISAPAILDAVIAKIHSCGVFSVTIHNSAQTISDHVKELRNKICQWSADIGNWKVSSKAVKDWFLLPGCGVSTWWFSLLSEKNTLKTDAYFRIAQTHAIEQLLSRNNYDLCLLSISNRSLHHAIVSAAKKHHIPAKVISARPLLVTHRYKFLILDYLERLGWFGSFLRGIFTWFHIILRCYAARKGLPRLTERKPSSNTCLFVSYFPAVDKETARNGVFRNKYALSLQDKLEEKKVPITWLLMPVPLDGYNFKDALGLAGKFASHGEKLFILEEFLTIQDAMKGLFLWFRQIGLSFFLFHQLKKTCLAAEPVGYPCHSIIRSLWNLSFCGPVAVTGILHALIFREVLKKIPGIVDCLYYCEMQAWEKALNAAKKDINPQIRTIGYQHSSVSRNDLSYFYDKTETVSWGKPSDLPLPDILACNGKYLYDLLSESGYPNLIETEAVRYLYLHEILSLESMPRKGRPLLLVAGPYNRDEAKALTSLVCAAFPRADRFDIWFKGHPSMPFEEIFQDLGLDYLHAGFIIQHDNISEYLSKAWAVIVPTSTVAMEALGAGCEVIIPVFPDAMLMNPLADFEDYHHHVTTPQELRLVMEKIVGGYSLHGTEEYQHFIRRYWNINPSLPLWSKLLEGSRQQYD